MNSKPSSMIAMSNDTPGKHRLVRRGPRPLALEQRFMFDGAAVAVAADAVADKPLAPSADTGEGLLHLATPATSATPSALGSAEAAAEKLIADFLQKPDAAQQLFMLFNGGQAEPSAEWLENANAFLATVRNGEFSLKVELRSSQELNGAMGAFAAAGPDGQPVIYLNNDLVETGTSPETLTRILLEEFGHGIDVRLNGATDTTGDEGQLFAAVLTGQDTTTLGYASDNDHTTLQIDGTPVNVELATFNFVNAYEVVKDLNGNAVIDNYDTVTDKESNTHNFNFTQNLGQVTVNDDTNSNLFSGNDVAAIGINIGGNTYYGWISRPIKANGQVKGFYFWTDNNFTSLAAAQADGNQDGDANVADNRGFLLVVDQSYFNSQSFLNIAGVAANTYKNVGSSSDRVDTAINSLILASNTAPVANPDTNTVSEGSLATGNVLTNDTDANGNTLTVSQFAINGQLYAAGNTATLAGVGTLLINANGTYTFTPAPGYNGSLPTATYVVSDGVATATSTLSITVTSINTAPVGVNDTATVTEDIPYSDNVLANDTDADGDTLSVTGFTFTPPGGSLTTGTVGASTIIPGVGSFILYSNGSYTFTPAANYDGPVPIITYTLSDGHGGTDTATLSLTITPVADDPTAIADTDTTAIEAGGVSNGTAGNGATGNVLSNDTASTGAKTIASIGTGTADLAVAASSTSSSNGTQVVGLYGTLTIGADGSYSYVVNDNNTAVQALRITGQTLSDVFTYKLTDGGTSSATTTLTITIDGRNDNPAAANDYNTAKESTTITGSTFNYTGYGATGDVLTNDADVDASGNGETLSIIGLSGTATGTTVGGTTSLSFSSPPSNVKAGYYVYWGSKALKDAAGTQIQIASGYVSGGTVPLTATIDPVQSGLTDVNGDGSTNVNDLLGQTITFTLKANGSGSSGTATLSTTTSLSSISISGISGTIAAGMTVDGAGITAGTTVSGVSYDTSGNVVSITLSQTATLSNTALTFAAAAGSTIVGQHGTLQLNANGGYTYTPTTDNQNLGEGQSAVEAFKYTMRDTASTTSTATLYITVYGTGGRDPIANDNTNSINEGGTISSGNLLTDATADIYDAGGGSIVSISSGSETDTTASSSQFVVNGRYGTLTVNVDGTYSYALDAGNATVNALHAGEMLTETFQYVLNDSSANTTHVGTDTGNLTITINGANDAPVGGKLPDGTTDPNYNTGNARYEITTPEDTPIAGQVKAFDSDDTSLTYSAGGTVPAHGAVTVNANGTYSYVPAGNYVGNDSFSVTVSDPHGASTTVIVYVTVTPVNDRPLLDLDGTTGGTDYSTSYTFGGTARSVADTDNSITDIDDTNIESATIVLTNAKTGDTLNVGTLPAGIAANTSIPGQVTLSGAATLDDYEAAIRAIGFSTTGSDRTTRTVTVVVNDGNDNSNTATTSISINLTPLQVAGVTVNEASPYAIFEVTGTGGQTISLQLEATGSSAGDAVLGLDTANAGTGVPLQYLDALNQWVDYTPGSTVTMNGSSLLVRTAIRQDSADEGLETYNLVAIDDAGVRATGQAGIIDDGSGDYFAASNKTTIPGLPNGTVLDDDRPLTVDTIAINEGASDYGVFTITGASSQLMKLALSAGTATSADFGPTLQYWDGSVWQNYTDNTYVAIPAGSTTLLVRTPIISDSQFERIEQFTLTASNTGGDTAAGYGLILDDGTGEKYPDSVPSQSNGIWSPVKEASNLDDDRTINVVAGGTFNEASPYATFTVSGQAGYTLNLMLGNTGSSADRDATIVGFSFDYSTDGGSNWTTYSWNGSTGNRPTVPTAGSILVRTAIGSEADNAYEGAETFTLTASYATNSSIASSDTDTITDDGSGRIDANGDGDIADTGEGIGPGAGFDDDRAIVVTGGSYNENSSRAIFTVAANPGLPLTFDVRDIADAGKQPTGDNEGGAGDALTNAAIYYSLNGGATWLLYTGTPVAAASVNVLVAVDIAAERDNVFEDEESFQLVVNPGAPTEASGYASIFDDGTGTVTDTIDQNTLNYTGSDNGSIKDDDRPSPSPPQAPPQAPPPSPEASTPTPEAPISPPPIPPEPTEGQPQPVTPFNSTIVQPSSIIAPQTLENQVSAIIQDQSFLRAINLSEPISDIYTSPSGFRVVVIEAQQEMLSLHRGLSDQYADRGSDGSFAVPYDAFAHTNPNEKILLAAMLADGTKLPDWIDFDQRSGKFIFKVPADFRGELTIKVVARDSKGQEVATLFRFSVGEKKGVLDGRSSFSEQLRQAARQPAFAAARTVADPGVPSPAKAA